MSAVIDERRLLAPASLLASLLWIESVLACSPAAAQGLTLKRAIALAQQVDERSRIAAQRVLSARAARRQAYAALLPMLSLSGSYRTGSRSTVGGGGFADGSPSTLSAGGRAELALIDPTAFARIAAAAHELDAQRSEQRELLRTLELDVAEAFFAVLAAEQVANAADQRVDVATTEARAAERRLEAGLVGRNDLTRAELEREAARLSALDARNGLINARLALGLLIGRDPPHDLVEPAGALVAALPEDELTRRALALREDLRALSARRSAADARSDEPWLTLLPRVDASGVVSLSEAPDGQQQSTDWTVAVVATWVLYDGGVRYAQAAARTAALRSIELELDALRRQVRYEVRLALSDLATRSDAVVVAEARRAAAEENLEQVRARFERGLDNALALADASEQAYLANAELAGQRLSLRLSELSLLRASGRYPTARPAPASPATGRQPSPPSSGSSLSREPLP